MNTITAEPVALDADTGAFCLTSARTAASISRSAWAGTPIDYVLTSAPTLAGTTVVVGGRVADNVSTDMPGGVMRGFDVVTGQLRWAFDPGNPNITLLPPAGEATRVRPNVWASMSYDPVSNTVFMPVGSSSVDLYGATRTDLDHQYGASMLALDATTGREKWVYQTVHNDLWDFDVPMQPSFIDFPRRTARPFRHVFGTKAGQLYVLDRATGEPLTKVDDAGQAGNIPNEPYAPTQRLSVGMPQIGAKTWRKRHVGRDAVRPALVPHRLQGNALRWRLHGSGHRPRAQLPGSLGMNWGGLSADRTRTTSSSTTCASASGYRSRKPPRPSAVKQRRQIRQCRHGCRSDEGTPYAVSKNRFLSALGIPCQARRSAA